MTAAERLSAGRRSVLIKKPDKVLFPKDGPGIASPAHHAILAHRCNELTAMAPGSLAGCRGNARRCRVDSLGGRRAGTPVTPGPPQSQRVEPEQRSMSTEGIDVPTVESPGIARGLLGGRIALFIGRSALAQAIPAQGAALMGKVVTVAEQAAAQHGADHTLNCACRASGRLLDRLNGLFHKERRLCRLSENLEGDGPCLMTTE
jgi:hypothetical protein